jgi:chorismate mutase
MNRTIILIIFCLLLTKSQAQTVSTKYSFQDSLSMYRKTIDSIDKQTILLLASRMEIVQKIGDIKKKNRLPVAQQDRWKELITRLKSQAVTKGLDTVFVVDIYNRIHEESKRIQSKQ